MGARLVFLNETKEQPESFDFAFGQVVAVSRGWDAGSRENEDCLLVRAAGDSVVLAVADGAKNGTVGRWSICNIHGKEDRRSRRQK